jgi:hypothetical protein
LGVNAANDWTKDMAKDGFPELKKLYGLYGAPDAVTFHNATHFGHNYNHVTRVPMYGFMNRLFGLGLEEPILERDFQVLKSADMTVWDDQHPKPQGGIEFETELLERWAKDVSAKVEASPEIRQTGWKTILSPANAVAKSLTVTDAKSENDVTTIRVINADGTNVGVLKTRVPLGTPGLKIRLLSDLKTAEAPKADEVLLAIDDAWGVNFGASEQSLVKNPRPAACYTYGYNPSLYLRKLAVLLALLDAPSTKSISGGQWQAQGALGTMIDAAAVLRPQTMKVPETPNSFDFSQVASIKDANMLPGALRFGNTAGLRLTARELSKQ